MQLLMTHPFQGEKLVYLDDIPRHKGEGWVDKSTVAETPKTVTIAPQSEVKRSAGNPRRREAPSIVNDRE